MIKDAKQNGEQNAASSEGEDLDDYEYYDEEDEMDEQ